MGKNTENSRTPMTKIAKKRKRKQKRGKKMRAISSAGHPSQALVLSSSPTAVALSRNSISYGDVEIVEDDITGTFIRLRNNSDKEVSLCRWKLVRFSGDREIQLVTTFVFNRQAKIDAKGTITIWSSDASEGAEKPPANIQMKGQNWSTSDFFQTILTDKAGQEQSVRETKRVPVMISRQRLGFGEPEAFCQQGRDERNSFQRCTITLS